MSTHNSSRRSFIKKAAYIAPVVLTLNATPTLAHRIGSAFQHCNQGVGNGGEGCTPGHSFDSNDESPNFVPGNPGAKHK